MSDPCLNGLSKEPVYFEQIQSFFDARNNHPEKKGNRGKNRKRTEVTK